MSSGKNRIALITGGAGFIGSNLAERLLRETGTRVRIFDNLSRAGVPLNLEWLQSLPGARRRLEFIAGDVRNASTIKEAARGASEIYHLAAQVAVTNSVQDPLQDFEVNARGTVNVLEAARTSGSNPFLLFTSTNKVYGALESLQIVPAGTRYRVNSGAFKGVNELQPLDFHSPYGCSKGAADQYVRDYGRVYGLQTAVFRMSCIAGPRQFGNEDQGWVAHFLYSALNSTPITVYGTGLQVRDVLHVHDLIDAMIAVRDFGSESKGQVYNVGGGLARAVSVLEMLRMIEDETGSSIQMHHGITRPGDQPLYVSDTSRLASRTGWQPKHSLADTLHAIHEFWRINSIQITTARDQSSESALAGEVA